jgi:serine/threonine protein phosphatase PrpC
MKNEKLHVFAVCDGHGQYGHHVSQLIKEILPKNIEL